MKQMADQAGRSKGFSSKATRKRRRRWRGTRQFLATSVEPRSGRRLWTDSDPSGVGYFFPRPSAGSACKRLNLFLRWMVRRDSLDLGCGRACRRRKLVVPLDTHVIRVGRCLRLTRYTSPGWRMAQDITASLRRLDPSDPVRYDFSICHLGMMNACGFSRLSVIRSARCAGCAGHARVNRRGLGDHPLDGKARSSTRANPAVAIRRRRLVVGISRTMAAAMARVIARLHQQRRDARPLRLRECRRPSSRRWLASRPSHRAATCRALR